MMGVRTAYHFIKLWNTTTEIKPGLIDDGIVTSRAWLLLA
jgi:hypothetical protein